MVKSLGELFIMLGSKFDPEGFKKTDKALNETGKKVGKFTKRTAVMSNTMKRSMMSLKTLIAAFGTGLAFKNITDTTLALDRAKIGFEAVGGSIERSNELMKEAGEIANKYALDLNSTRRGLRDILGAMKGGTYTQEQGIELFNNLAKAVAGLRMTSVETKGALNAFGQILSKGKVQAEELRRQLANNLPGAFPIAAKALKMTSAELDKALRDGLVTSDALFKIAAGLAEEFGKNAEKAATGVSGSFQRMKNNAQEFLEIIAEEGFGEGLRIFSIQMGELLRSGDVTEFAKNLGKATKSFAENLPEILKHTKEIFKFLVDIIPILKFIFGVFLFSKAIKIAGKVFKYIGGTIKATAKLAKTTKDIHTALFTRVPATVMGIDIAKVLRLLVKQGKFLKVIFGGLGGPLVTALMTAADVIGTIIGLISGKSMDEIDTITAYLVDKLIWIFTNILPELWKRSFDLIFRSGRPDFKPVQQVIPKIPTSFSADRLRRLTAGGSTYANQTNNIDVEVHGADNTQQLINAITGRLPDELMTARAFASGG